MSRTYRYDLSSCIDPIAAEEDLALARFAVACLFGSPRVKQELGYRFECDGQVCVLETRGHAGEAAAQLFTGLCTARLGDDGFTIVATEAVPS